MKIVFGLILTVCFIAAEAQVYKWTDAEGQTHYSDVEYSARATVVPAKLNVFDFRKVLSGMVFENAVRERRLNRRARIRHEIYRPAQFKQADPADVAVQHVKRPPPRVVHSRPMPVGVTGAVIRSGNTWTVQK